MLGRELLDIFPVAFLPENHALAIAIMSYNGKIDFGLLGDYDAMEDVTLIAEGIEAEIKQLLEAATAGGEGGEGGSRRATAGRRAASSAKASRPRAHSGMSDDERRVREPGRARSSTTSS